MLEHHAACHLEEFQTWVLFLQDGAPPQWSLVARRFFECKPFKPMGWKGLSSNITFTGNYTSWHFNGGGGYTKDKVFSSSVPDIKTLRPRITDVLAIVTNEMLEKSWQRNRAETEYHSDVLQATIIEQTELHEQTLKQTKKRDKTLWSEVESEKKPTCLYLA